MMTTSEGAPIQVFGRDGHLGTVVQPGRPGADSGGHTLIALADGTHIHMLTDLLARQDDGSYFLPYSLAEIRQGELLHDGQRIVIPVVAEELVVGKRVVETGRVRVRKLVQEHSEQIDTPVLREEVQVERVPRNQILDQPAAVRYEGEVMIIPVMEEVLVIEKRLMLREEVHITKQRSRTSESREIPLRREEVVVERLEPSGEAAGRAQDE
jgi:uncharacterized protein (TIGR02271 family)